jgi:hypothetical protein
LAALVQWRVLVPELLGWVRERQDQLRHPQYSTQQQIAQQQAKRLGIQEGN